jgi:hypothetical protein
MLRIMALEHHGDGTTSRRCAVAVPGERLRHVFWLGGGSGAGKSTIARRLATEHGWHRYSTDHSIPEHASRSTPGDAPYLHQFLSMTMDERWVDRSPETMLESFHWFRGEGFDMIVDDLLRLPREPPVIVEGFRLLPRLVQPLLTTHAQAAWLLPTPGFRRAAFDSRGSTWEIAGRTRDPERALRNLLERDRLFTERLRAETRALDLRAIEVVPAATEDGLAARVTAVFGL